MLDFLVANKESLGVPSLAPGQGPQKRWNRGGVGMYFVMHKEPLIYWTVRPRGPGGLPWCGGRLAVHVVRGRRPPSTPPEGKGLETAPTKPRVQ